MKGYATQLRAFVVLRFGPDEWNSVPARMAGGGFARIVKREIDICGLPTYLYAPSKSLLDIARLRGWRIERFADGDTQILIPIGRYRYTPRSDVVGVLQPDYAYVDPVVQLVPNANLQTLEALAPHADWTITPVTGNDASLFEAMKPHLTTVTFHRSGRGWSADSPAPEEHRTRTIRSIHSCPCGPFVQVSPSPQ